MVQYSIHGGKVFCKYLYLTLQWFSILYRHPIFFYLQILIFFAPQILIQISISFRYLSSFPTLYFISCKYSLCSTGVYILFSRDAMSDPSILSIFCLPINAGIHTVVFSQWCLLILYWVYNELVKNISLLYMQRIV